VEIREVVAGAAIVPVRAGLDAAEAGIALTRIALGYVKQALGQNGAQTAGSVESLIPLRDAMVGAAVVSELTDENSPMGRMLVPGGAADQLARPGGVLDQLAASGGLLDRLSANGGSLERILAPGGLVNRMFAEDGPIERMFAEDGPIERAFAEDGSINTLTAANGPLEKITEAAEILSGLQPAIDKLAPTAQTIESGVDTLNRLVASLSSIADRLPRRRSKPVESPPASDPPDPH
jgi:hypothetical protein